MQLNWVKDSAALSSHEPFKIQNEYVLRFNFV